MPSWSGAATAADDDPLLTVRLPGMTGRTPTRIVLDPGLALSLGSRLVETAPKIPLLLLTGPEASALCEQALAERGVDVSRISPGDGGLDLPSVLQELATRGFTRILCEGGPTLASALIGAGLADRVILLTGPDSSAGTAADPS